MFKQINDISCYCSSLLDTLGNKVILPTKHIPYPCEPKYIIYLNDSNDK